MRPASWLSFLRTHAGLSAIFAVVFLTASITRLPAALVLPYAAQAGVDIKGASGSLWNGRFSTIQFRDMRFESGAYRFTPSGLMSGASVGQFTLSGGIAQIDGRLNRLGNGRIELADFSAKVDYPLRLRQVDFNPRIELTTDTMSLTYDGQCVSGDIAVTMRVNAAALAMILPRGAQWNGSANCENGRVAFLLNPNDSGLVAVIRGEINGLSYNAEIDLALDDRLTQSREGRVALRQAGFKKQNGQWRAQIRGIL